MPQGLMAQHSANQREWTKRRARRTSGSCTLGRLQLKLNRWRNFNLAISVTIHPHRRPVTGLGTKMRRTATSPLHNAFTAQARDARGFVEYRRFRVVVLSLFHTLYIL
jgi:hypothetical protein